MVLEDGVNKRLRRKAHLLRQAAQQKRARRRWARNAHFQFLHWERLLSMPSFDELLSGLKKDIVYSESFLKKAVAAMQFRKVLIPTEEVILAWRDGSKSRATAPIGVPEVRVGTALFSRYKHTSVEGLPVFTEKSSESDEQERQVRTEVD